MSYVDIVYVNDGVTGFPIFDVNGYPVFSPSANAGANTYAQFQAKIQNEILGSPTPAQIQNAIADAIANFESMSFWFNQIRYWGGQVPLASYGLASDGGVLILAPNNYWPTSTTTPGAFYSDAGVCAVYPGGTYNPVYGPVYFGQISQQGLLALGGDVLPTSDPGVATQLWNMSGQVTISSGPGAAPYVTPIPSGSLLQTVAGQELYSAIDLPLLAAMPAISNIQVIAFNNRYSLRSRTKDWMDEQSVSPSWQGLPTDYAIVNGTSVRLYPIPNDVYPLIIYGTTRFYPLVNNSDYNCWTNRGEALIRQEAKRLLFLNITRNPLQAMAMQKEIYGDPGNPYQQGILSRLRRESQTRLGTGGGGKIRASRGHM